MKVSHFEDCHPVPNLVIYKTLLERKVSDYIQSSTIDEDRSTRSSITLVSHAMRDIDEEVQTTEKNDDDKQIEFEDWQQSFLVNNEPLCQDNPSIDAVYGSLESRYYEFDVEGPTFINDIDSESDDCNEV